MRANPSLKITEIRAGGLWFFFFFKLDMYVIFTIAPNESKRDEDGNKMVSRNIHIINDPSVRIEESRVIDKCDTFTSRARILFL